MPAAPPQKDPLTLVLEAIDRGDYRPGDRLVEAELAERFGVSRTPVREALQRLETQGILARDGGEGIASEAFGAIVAISAALLLLGALSGLAAVLAASKAGASADSSDDPDGLTLEWVEPAVDDSPLRDYAIAVVRSPYPLLDLRDGGSDEEGS